MDRKRNFIHLAYSGKNYRGWQAQKNGPSVQAVMEQALSTLLSEEIKITGCGRTDAGVHAESFYAHFDLTNEKSASQLELLVRGLNGYLPGDIAVLKIFQVHPDAHARFSAISRTYEYRIVRVKSPFSADFSYVYFTDLNVSIMNEASRILFEYSDFTSFAKLHSNSKTNFCKITEAIWTVKGNMLIFRITADRFLRNMVRSIVGTMLQTGRDKVSIPEFRRIIEDKKRSGAGTSAPAKGLFLVDVQYPEDIFIQI